MRPFFPLYQSHLDLAHRYWSQLVLPGDTVIDATAGNGHDTLYLCQLALHGQTQGIVYALDIQKEALAITRKLLETHLSPKQIEHVVLKEQCHSSFPEEIANSSVKLIVYNLGYLPGGDKKKTTQRKTTITSLTKGAALICPGGIISVTCYPGHEEGAEEEKEILSFLERFSPKEWSCCHHRVVNRSQSPSLIIIQKALG